MKSLYDLIVFGVLSPQFDGDATSLVACLTDFHNPLAARLRVKVPTRNDESLLRCAKLDLQVETLSQAEICTLPSQDAGRGLHFSFDSLTP